MSGKSSTHIPWAFSLESAPELPVIGEFHPLRQEAPRWLVTGGVCVILLALAIFASWKLYSRHQPTAPPQTRVRIVHYTDLGVPPSISRTVAPPQVNVAQAVAPPSIGIPEPVPDDVAPQRTIATVSEMAEALAPITMDDLGLEGGDGVVVDIDIQVDPQPDEFVAVEEDPVRIRIDPPVYPDLARQAGVEGTVMVRVLVGVDGKVKNAIVLDGIDMLNEAALVSAKSAVFRPALMQHKPVEVWVVMPVVFKLRG